MAYVLVFKFLGISTVKWTMLTILASLLQNLRSNKAQNLKTHIHCHSRLLVTSGPTRAYRGLPGPTILWSSCLPPKWVRQSPGALRAKRAVAGSEGSRCREGDGNPEMLVFRVVRLSELRCACGPLWFVADVLVCSCCNFFCCCCCCPPRHRRRCCVFLFAAVLVLVLLSCCRAFLVLILLLLAFVVVLSIGIIVMSLESCRFSGPCDSLSCQNHDFRWC